MHFSSSVDISGSTVLSLRARDDYDRPNGDCVVQASLKEQHLNTKEEIIDTARIIQQHNEGYCLEPIFFVVVSIFILRKERERSETT